VYSCAYLINKVIPGIFESCHVEVVTVNAMKTIGEVEVWLHWFLTSILEWVVDFTPWLAYPRGSDPRYIRVFHGRHLSQLRYSAERNVPLCLSEIEPRFFPGRNLVSIWTTLSRLAHTYTCTCSLSCSWEVRRAEESRFFHTLLQWSHVALKTSATVCVGRVKKGKVHLIACREGPEDEQKYTTGL